MHLVLVGPPGVGKGTQSKRLVNHFRIPHVATGDILRNAMKEDSDWGRQIRDAINQGNLVSDELILELVRERLKNSDCSSGCLFDGIPRTIPQAEKLDSLLVERNAKVDALIELIVGEEELTRRLTGRAEAEGRSDDAPETVRHRMDVYRAQTVPILGHYQRLGVLRRVDGVGSTDEVFQRILAAFEA